MKTKNRLIGLMACLVMLFFGLILLSTPLREIGLLLMMFSAGYGLRDSLEGEIEKEEDLEE